MGIWQQMVGRWNLEEASNGNRPLSLRNESAERAGQRVHHLERSLTAVKRKLEKALALDTPSTDDARFDQFIAESIAFQWEPSQPAQPWGIDEQAVRPIIIQSAREYFTAFRILASLMKEPDAKPGYEAYHAKDVSLRLYEIYSNHVANLTEARLIEQGLDPIAAHRINGFIIRHCVDIGEEVMRVEPYVVPAVLRPKDEANAIKQIDYVRHFWQHKAEKLNEALAAQAQR